MPANVSKPVYGFYSKQSESILGYTEGFDENGNIVKLSAWIHLPPKVDAKHKAENTKKINAKQKTFYFDDLQAVGIVYLERDGQPGRLVQKIKGFERVALID